MGVESSLEPNPSIALGTSEVTPLELTAAYVPYSNGGYRPDVHFIRRVTTTKGEVLYEHEPARAERVADPEIVGMMNAMLSETIRSGTAQKADFGWPAAGKTGTSQNSRDAWFVGYTANLTTGVWFGNDDGRPTEDITGGGLPTLAWKEFMTAAHDGVPVAQLPGNWGDPIARMLRPRESVGNAPRQPLPEFAGGFDGNPDATTAAIRRPVPPGAVGERSRRETSILDVILGR
jgi:penicillin-binding protein 1A